MQKPKLAAQRLLEAHARREPFAPLPPELAPRTAEEAYTIQDWFVALRAEKLGAIAGYKIALSSQEMQRFVGVDEPQAGVMLESTLQRTPAKVRAMDYVHLVVEFEIAVQMAADLNADYRRLAQAPLELIADNGWIEGAVLGLPVTKWASLDLGALRGVATINGKVVGEGIGAAAMGHPLEALAWVANHLAAHGRGLVFRDVVITGSIITTKTVQAGDLVKFAVEGLGEAELRVD